MGSRLGEEKVKQIFSLREQGVSVRDIAESVGVSQQAVSYHLYPKYRESTIRRAKERPPEKSSGWRLIYFKCPRCNSGNIDVHLLRNCYECNECKNVWK